TTNRKARASGNNGSPSPTGRSGNTRSPCGAPERRTNASHRDSYTLTASALGGNVTWRFCLPVNLQGLLEPVARKRARPVLRGPWRSNAPGLPDEVFFGIITRQAIRRGSYNSVKDLIAAIETYIDGWNERCQP